MSVKRVVLVLLIAAITVVIAVSAGWAAKSPFVVGAIFSTTGDNAPLGVPERQSVEMVAKQINAAGGIAGHPLKVEFYDDGGNPQQAVQACSQLLNKKGVIAIIGPTLSGPSLAIADMCQRAKMPLVSCAASAKIVLPVRSYIFKTAQSDSLAVERIIVYLKSKKISRVGFIYDSNAFGSSGRDQWNIFSRMHGIKTVAMESFGSADADMTAQLTRVKGARPQAIICWGTNPGPAVVASGVKKLGLKMPLIMSHGIANKTFIDLAKSGAEGVVFPAGKLIVANQIPNSDPQKKQLLAYAAAYQKAFGKAPNTFGGHAWDAIMLVAKAAAKSNGDRAKIRAALENTKGFVGISGIFNMSPKDHNGINRDAFAFVKISKGKWTLAK